MRTSDGLSGDGATVIKRAVEPARFIAIGEDHATREISAFVTDLCKQNSDQLSGLVLEAGPRALSQIRPILASKDRPAKMAAFNARYPDSIAFLDISADNDLAATCLAEQPRLKIIGIDQEFLGSAGLLIDQILAQRLSADARSAMLVLKRKERELEEKAAKSQSPGDLLLIGASDADLEAASAALRRGGSAQAQAIMADLLKSREIYRTNGNRSNQIRAALLKANLAAQLPRTGKVLIKMGDWHLYRGYNPLNNRDVGNWIAEKADSEGQPSLHILVLGAAGVHALYDGYRKPWRHVPFKMSDDPDYRWLQAAVDASHGLAGTDWALFDLRPLRDRRIAGLDVAWRRVLDGYDLMILIPELTPSDRLVK